MNLSSVSRQEDSLPPTTTESPNQPKIQDINPLIKGLVITGKILFMATMIAGLVAFCIFVPPLGWGLAIEVVVIVPSVILGLVALGGTISAITGLISNLWDCPADQNGRFSNMFRYTDHNALDCGIFLLNSIGLASGAQL